MIINREAILSVDDGMVFFMQVARKNTELFRLAVFYG